MVTCETVATLGGAYALELLPADEAAAVAVHVATCVGCGERTRARQQAGDWLAHLVAPAPLPEALRRRLHLRLLDAPRPQPRETAPLDPGQRPVPSSRPPRRWWPAAAAVAALLAVLAWKSVPASDHHDLARAERLAREAQATLTAHRQRQNAAPSAAPTVAARLARLHGSRRHPAAVGALAWQSEDGRWTLTAQGLPSLQPGQVFQLWAGHGERPVPVVATRPATRVLAVPVPALGALKPGTPLLLTVENGAARERPAGDLVLLGLVPD